MDIDIHNEKLSLPIDVLNLDVYTYNALRRGNVSTLLDIVNHGEKSLRQIYQMSPKRVSYVLEKLNTFMLQTQEPALAEIQNKLSKKVSTIYLYESPSSEKPNLVQEIEPIIKIVLKSQKLQNDYEILKRRYGLENSNNYTLQEVGNYLGITRERVRQIESRAETNIYQTLTDSFRPGKWHVPLPKNIIDEAKDLFSELLSLGVVITEHEALTFMQKRYGNGVQERDLGSIRLLMSLSGWDALPKTIIETSVISLAPSWALFKRVDKPLLFKVIGVVYHLLLKENKPVSKFDIIVQMNGKLRKKVDTTYLDYAAKICSEIQKIDEETFEFRFQSLPSVADKAYRILYRANKPLHSRDILREINYLQIKVGEQGVNDRTLKGQLASDKRFEPIGKSGDWSLVEWEHVAKDTISDLMQEYFHLNQKTATAREIFDYVHTKRKSVKAKSIHTYLGEKKLFTRVANGEYGLSAWGLKPLPFERIGSAEINAQIDLAVKNIFAAKKTDKLPLWAVVESVSEITGISVLTVRKKISNLPYLSFEPHPSHPNRKYLKLLKEDNHRVINSKTDVPKSLLRDTIQNEIEKYLHQQPDKTASLFVIAAHVMKKTGCRKPTFYRYLAEMENIKKSKSKSVVTCQLIVKSTVLDFPQINAVTDPELRENLKRAINNFNVDNIDLGLFQLGKIFESELRSYLVQAKTRNAFQVTSKDLERLVDMINCLERNRVIVEKHHLTLLREHRNERAHGNIPNIDERQVLMKHAPFLGDMYIKYITLVNEKRQRL